MKQRTKRSQVMVLVFMAGTVVLLAAGCDCPRKLKSLQQENQLLNERVMALENELAMADAATAPAYSPQAPAEAVYIVAKGDTLWSIAKKQLGKGSRYKEILAMNPGISENVPLTIGTKLKIPAQ